MAADLAVATKRCTRCGKRKPLEAFSPDTYKRDGLQTWCKTCRADYIRERRSKDPLLASADRAQVEAYNAALRVLRDLHRAEFDLIYTAERERRGLD